MLIAVRCAMETRALEMSTKVYTAWKDRLKVLRAKWFKSYSKMYIQLGIEKVPTKRSETAKLTKKRLVAVRSFLFLVNTAMMRELPRITSNARVTYITTKANVSCFERLEKDFCEVPLVSFDIPLREVEFSETKSSIGKFRFGFP